MQKRHIIIKYDVEYDCELIFYDFTFSWFSKTLFRMQVIYLFNLLIEFIVLHAQWLIYSHLSNLLYMMDKNVLKSRY